MLAWLESERRRSVTIDEAAAALGWPSKRTREVLARLSRKGWLKRLARGRYETILAETGGWALPNPWAALSLWQQPYYVGFQSAAFELGLTPDRPAAVQACVPVGAKRPRAWEDMPIELVYLRTFTLEGAEQKTLHGFPVVVAATEKLLLDAAALPARIGGIFGLARVVDRALDRSDWERVAEFGERSRRGRTALRRLAATVEILGRPVPRPLAVHAVAARGASPLYLGERRVFGSRGPRLDRWQVVANVDADALREEVAR
ncbi:MAG: type IV toxin-antitoxin system AbiEi family antitoxin domain-containing protein [Gaiellaceae bacterium]